ncbi:glycosyltransferase [Caulobacter vibrioides]|uniref:Glycosyltransferase n=1 Tax=Caulobacter vibrioides (strain NA1000 / CB15N) TaxID=565050 RepID=A0A0H3C5G9_CAUVN|nr:glycosyltransferase family 4 protein [Caulobacter vibrioides]YP_002515839.1 GT4 PimA-like glycosyltransferase [Caulobacter vibrioides NA1000]QBQ56907.1 glycosyltransferase [synthetic Caulobacter sp. 'ethensis']ACL93931.1 GT4 PimA-like glycosyltransferase [Caulobacter vibrioides NA1000]ATC27284.1 hypothetical protein CA607_02350 [Caulobacter vibrioides]AZH11665.1 glycosyltransferase [Caulobacter vibrioides]
MRIAVYCKDYFPMETGFSIAFRGFCESIVKYNPDIEITVITPAQVDQAVNGGAGVDRLNVVRLKPYHVERQSKLDGDFFLRISNTVKTVQNRILWSRDITKIFLQKKFDYILFESADDLLLMALLPKSILRRSVIRFHSTGDTETARYGTGLLRRIERRLIKFRIAKNVKAILSTNEFHLNFVKAFYFENDPYRLANCYFGIVPNVVRDELDQNGDGSKSQYIKPDLVNVVTLGRMDKQGVAQKGFEDLLFALSSMKPADREKLNIIIIGDGDCREDLSHLAKSLNLSNVVFAGRMANSQVRNTLRDAEVVALLSRFEGLSMFAIEGMLSRSAVFFTRAGALVDLVQGNGWAVDVQSVDQMTSAFTAIALTDKSTLSEFGSRSYQMATERFSEEAVARIGASHLYNCLQLLKRQ